MSTLLLLFLTGVQRSSSRAPRQQEEEEEEEEQELEDDEQVVGQQHTSTCSRKQVVDSSASLSPKFLFNGNILQRKLSLTRHCTRGDRGAPPSTVLEFFIEDAGSHLLVPHQKHEGHQNPSLATQRQHAEDGEHPQ
jgi:hypothetical protein